MEAGSGGIRYNDSLKQIQLMDTNKNWVNWKYFDAYAEFKFCAKKYLTNDENFSYTFESNGLYLLCGSGEKTQYSSVTTTAGRSDLIYNIATSGTRIHNLIAFYATAGDTLTLTSSTYTYYGGFGLYFIGSGFSNISIVDRVISTDSSGTLSFTNASNRILIAYVSGASRSINMNSALRDSYSDGTSTACVASVRETGSATITASGSTGGSCTIISLLVS